MCRALHQGTDCHTIAGEVSKGLKPPATESAEVVLLEQTGVESVGVVDEILGGISHN